MSSSTTACFLKYWVMVTNTSLFTQLKHTLEASFVQVPRKRNFRRQSVHKVGHVRQSVYRPFGRFSTLKFAVIAWSFLACVEDFELFQHTATQILIGLLDASFANNYFFIVGIQFQFVTELVEENCGHNLRITDDGGNHPRN